MAPAVALALLCISPTMTLDRMTIANRLPSVCTEHLGAPPWPVSAMPAAVAPPVAEPPKVEPKKAVKKKPNRKRCKPGRTRNAAGICGRWRKS